LRQSRSARPNPYHNAWSESVIGRLQTELLQDGCFMDETDTRTELFANIEGCSNSRHRHSSLPCLAPASCEASPAKKTQHSPKNPRHPALRNSGASERGRKPPLGVLSRVWQAPAMNATFPTVKEHERTGDEVSAERYRLIADKIEADPALLDIPLANIARWLANGHSAVQRLEGWRAMLLEAKTSRVGLQKVLDILRDEEWEAMMWKGFSPFPGILNKEELARLSWTLSH